MEENKKQRHIATKRILGIFVAVLAVSTIVMVGTASAKSLYLVADHHTAQFDAWNINPDGTATYQATYNLTNATDPAGVAIDEEYDSAGNVISATLFISSEFSLAGFELVDAIAMTSIGTAPGPYDTAGIAVDVENNVIYAVERWTDNLTVYDWDPSTNTITPRAGYTPFDLPNCSGAFGIALDETTDTLWVADSAAGVARAYNITSWTEDTSKSFTPIHYPVDIIMDRQRGYVYTVSMTAGAWTPPRNWI